MGNNSDVIIWVLKYLKVTFRNLIFHILYNCKGIFINLNKIFLKIQSKTAYLVRLPYKIRVCFEGFELIYLGIFCQEQNL